MLQKRQTILALISMEREFLLADAKNEIVQIFSYRRVHMGKRNREVYVSNLFVHIITCSSLMKRVASSSSFTKQCP